MTCYPESKIINPISAAVLSAFGSNYFPLYNTSFQATSQSDFVNDKLLEIVTPGDGKVKPAGGPRLGHISETVSTILGGFGAIFAIFAPIFLILDLIRNIIDLLCALISPTPMILTLVEMFVTTIPGIIALYPYFSSVLLAINTAKILIATSASMISAMIPIADNIVANALEIPKRIAEGNVSAVDSISTNICVLLSMFSNQLGGFAPFSFIIEMLKKFMGLGGRLFCLSEASCCDAANCPPIIINPPAGRAIVREQILKFTMQDLVQFIIDRINITLEKVSNFINDILPNIFDQINGAIDGINKALTSAIDGINKTLAFLFNDVLGAINEALFGALDVVLKDVVFEGIPPLGFSNASVPTVDLTLGDAPDYLGDFIIIQPSMTLELLELPVSTENDAGRISEKGVGNPFTYQEFNSLSQYIIDPNKLPEPEPDPNNQPPATIKVDITNVDTGEVIAGAGLTSVFVLPPTPGVTAPAIMKVRADNFSAGTVVEYRIRPQEITLFKMNLIGLGCLNDVAVSAGGVKEMIDDVGGTSPGVDKVGRHLPEPPTLEIQGCIDAQELNPAISQAGCAAEIINNYIVELTSFAEDATCAIASGSSSTFTKDKIFITADGTDASILSLTPKEIGGTGLLINPIPNMSFRAVFNTNFGKIEDLPFDDATGTFKARITSDKVGTAQITAKLTVKGQECFTAKNFDGFTITQNVQEVVFRSPPETFKKRRRRPEYVQSSGGRRR